MGFRVKRYGPLSTIVVVGRLVGTFEPALVIVTTAQTPSASARTTTIAPSQPAGVPAGRNGNGTSQPSARPATIASPHAIGGRMMARAVSAVPSLLILPPKRLGHEAARIASCSRFADAAAFFAPNRNSFRRKML